MKISFIGPGVMDRPMARNLVKAGHKLCVNDFHKEVVDDLVAQGATAVADAEEAALILELVITILPNSLHVKTVALDENGIVEGAHEGFVYIDMPPITPLVPRRVHDELAKVGILMLDAPVSGGEPKATGGTLTVVAGGDKAMFEQVAPVLDVMAGSVIYVGTIGVSNVTKLANQTTVAINIATHTEAFTLAQEAGVDPEAVFQAVHDGPVGLTIMNVKVPMTFARNFTPGFRINLHIKDLNNVLDTGHGVNSPLPLTAAVCDMMSVLQGDGFDTDDHSGLLKYYEKLSDIELRPGESEE